MRINDGLDRKDGLIEYTKLGNTDIEVSKLADKYNCKMSQIAIAWQWAKGVASPIIGATKQIYLDEAASAFNVKLTAKDIAYLE